MGKFSDLHIQMQEDIGEDATSEEIDQWFIDYCQQAFFPPVSPIKEEKNEIPS